MMAAVTPSPPGKSHEHTAMFSPASYAPVLLRVLFQIRTFTGACNLVTVCSKLHVRHRGNNVPGEAAQQFYGCCKWSIAGCFFLLQCDMNQLLQFSVLVMRNESWIWYWCIQIKLSFSVFDVTLKWTLAYPNSLLHVQHILRGTAFTVPGILLTNNF